MVFSCATQNMIMYVPIDYIEQVHVDVCLTLGRRLWVCTTPQWLQVNLAVTPRRN